MDKLNGDKSGGNVAYEALPVSENDSKDNHVSKEAEFTELEAFSGKQSARDWLTPLVVGLVMGSAIVFTGMGILANQSKTPTAKTPPVQPANMTVTLAAVQNTSVSRTLDATGSLAAYDLVSVVSQASGLQIKSILITEGENVRLGQVLAVLDDSVLRSQLKEAQANVESAKAIVQQKQTTVSQAKDAVSQAKDAVNQAKDAVSQAKNAVSQAKDAVNQAKASLAQARANSVQAQKTLERYQKLAKEGAISNQNFDTYQTAAITAQEAVNVAEAVVKSAETNVKSAETKYKTSETNLKSTETNVKSAETNVKSAETNVKSAEANVKSSEARVVQIITQLGQTKILAPASGILAEKLAKVGDVTSNLQNQKLFTIIRNGIVELQAKIPENQISGVKIGASVLATSDADSSIKVEGKVREISPTVDAQTRQAIVKIDLSERNLSLKPGMFLRAAITTKNVQGLTIPAKAVLPQSDGKGIVYVLEDKDKARAKTVEMGNTIGSDNPQVEIKSGLAIGEQVIVAGAGYLKDGDKVQVVK